MSDATKAVAAVPRTTMTTARIRAASGWPAMTDAAAATTMVAAIAPAPTVIALFTALFTGRFRGRAGALVRSGSAGRSAVSAARWA